MRAVREHKKIQGNEPSKGFERAAKDLQAVMFDLDGTLIDSIPVYLKIASAMLDKVGLPQASREAVAACIGRLGVDGARTLFVGDTDVDILAGKGAGTFTVGVLTGVDDYETLLAQRPDMIIAGVRELIPLF